MRIGYARVSTRGQDLRVQIQQLQEEGCEEIYEEKFTGAKTDRPMFTKLMKELKEGDTLVVTKLDRMARNTVEGIEVVRELFDRGVKVQVLNIGTLENTSLGQFFLTTLLAVAEMERSMIVERTQEGKAIARQQPGFKEGRPRTPRKKIEHALKLKETHSYKQVEEMTGISKSTLIRAKKRLEAENNAE